MSELQDIAANVDAVAGEIGTVVQQLTAQAVRNRQTANQANAVLAGSADPRPKQVTQQLDTAAHRCEQAAQALQLAQQAAKQFVRRIAGGGGGSGAGPLDASGGSGGSGPTINSRTAGGGLNFLADSDIAGQYANRNGGVAGYQDVVIHGNPFHFGLSDKTPVQPATLARSLQSSPDLSSLPIRLVSCKAGQIDDGAAQQLANEIGRPVLAATDTVYPLSDGRLVVGLNNSGQWRIFVPR